MDKQKFSSPLSSRCADKGCILEKRKWSWYAQRVIRISGGAERSGRGAAPSYCMHNFKAAGKQNEERREQGKEFEEPVYTFRGFEALPEDPAHPEDDKFYGFVFQDSDFYKWIEGSRLLSDPASGSGAGENR